MGLFGPPNIEKMKARGDIKGLVKALCYWKKKDYRGRAESVRRAAVKALVEIGQPAVEQLISALLRHDSFGEIGAVQALGKIGDARAVEPLIARLKSDWYMMRQAAVEAVGMIGDSRAVQPLIAVLEDRGVTYDTARKMAAEVLGKIGDARAVMPLLFVQSNDNDQYDVRQEAAEALGKIGAPAVEPLIAAALKDGNEKVRKAAGEALVRVYKQGKLSEEQKKLLLSQKDKLTKVHRDTYGHSDESEREHLDETHCGDFHDDIGPYPHLDNARAHSDDYQSTGVDLSL